MILDYCHNVDGMRRLAEFVDLMMAPQNGSGGAKRAGRANRAIGVIGMPGDRRDEDHGEYGRIAAHSFDEIIVREDRNLRGRGKGKSAELVKHGVEKGMAEKGARCTKVKIVLNEQDAALTGMHDARRGDMIMICSDDTRRSTAGSWPTPRSMAYRPSPTLASWTWKRASRTAGQGRDSAGRCPQLSVRKRDCADRSANFCRRNSSS